MLSFTLCRKYQGAKEHIQSSSLYIAHQSQDKKKKKL